MIHRRDISRDEPPEEQPPGFRSWGGVYMFVFGIFVLVVLLLGLFTATFA